MTELIVVSLAFLIAIIVVVLELNKSHNQQIERILSEHRADAEVWKVERQQLLDRIQAPSFEHLKHAEVKVLRAQNQEKPEPKSELL